MNILVNQVINKDCRDGLKELPDNSIDAIVTDPPYELGFMNKKWDSTGIAYKIEVWQECLRVLKPGGHLLAFGGTRTYHRLACAIEDAGFEIRDQIQWIYGSGFPKNHDISKAIDKKLGAVRTEGLREWKGGKRSSGILGNNHGTQVRKIYDVPATEKAQQWEGWGTALKPAHEPIVMARKPFKKSIADNVLEWGTGGINIDGCRIGNELRYNQPPSPSTKEWIEQDGCKKSDIKQKGKMVNGRFPANVILDEEAGKLLDEQSGFSKNTPGLRKNKYDSVNAYHSDNPKDVFVSHNDQGGASRFFYCAKASKKERNLGLNDKKETTVNDGRKKPIDNPYQRGKTERKNNHPTVKPIKLMEYLVKLVTPPQGIVLDPFVGSGTTLIAAKKLGFNFIGFEVEEEYCNIAKSRLSYFDGHLFMSNS